MHVFVIGQNLSEIACRRARSAIVEINDIYPTLDRETCWFFHPNDKVFAAGISHSQKAIAPRQYTSISDNEVVLYDGCMVDISGRINAHKASDLGAIWNDAAGRLEGQFVAARILSHPASIDIFTDQLAIYQAYTCRIGNSWLYSNSIHLIKKIRGYSEMEPKTAAMLLSSSMIMGGYTLEKGVHALTGGDRFIWREDQTNPENIPYFCRSEWSLKKKLPPTRQFIDELARRMTAPLCQLTETFGPLEAPITAGRDSRVMLALLHDVETQCNYFTKGAKGMVDVDFGAQISETLDLPHRIVEYTDEEVIPEWKDLCAQLILQTDGTVTPAHAANIHNRPKTIDRLDVLLYGAGGEFARKLYEEFDFFWRTLTLGGNEKFLIKLGNDSKRKLPTPESNAMTQAFQKQLLRQLSSEGFRHIDLLHAYYVFLRYPAWAGGNFRSVSPFVSVYSPFCTATFAKATFAVHPLYRYNESLHYRLISQLRPSFSQLPIHPQYWRPQNIVRAALNMCKTDLKKKIKDLLTSGNKEKPAKIPDKRYRQYVRMKWLLAHMAFYREKCLDTKSSILWDLVDRDAFEKLISNQPDAAEIGENQDEVFTVIRLFEYECLYNSDLSPGKGCVPDT